MKQSKVHSCVIQEMVAMGKMEPRKPKCRCRKAVDFREADEMVKRGEALWVIVSRERGVQEKACKLCIGFEPSLSCELCKGTGRVRVPAVWDTYNSDIVLINHRTKSNKVSTPRVPTIESEHIERAYVEGVKEVAERIEEYGMLILKDRLRLLTFGLTNEEFEAAWRECEKADFLTPGCSLVPIRLEPEDNPRTGSGRNCDWGRAI